MFRLSLIELSFTCLVVVLILVIPAVIMIHLRRTNQRLDALEKRLKEKE